MKFSDYFKSMEEVIQYVEQFKNYEIYETMKFIFGLSEQQGLSDEVEGIGLIDRTIAMYIRNFNKVGLITLSSESGLNKDHPQRKESEDGYISFLYTEEVSKVVRQVAERLYLTYEEGECYLKSDCCVRFNKDTDFEKETDWNNFYQLLMEEWTKGGFL